MRDIIENARAILQYTQKMDFDAFVGDNLTKDATERCLSRISEAGVKLGPIAEDLFPSHDWRGIRNVGNILRHDYEGVLDEVTWAIVTTKLPALVIDLEKFLKNYPDEQETF